MPKKSDYETCSFCGKKYLWWESPMLKDSLWESISNEDFDEKGKWVGQMMCLECMEKKLGRNVKETDLMLMESFGKYHHVWWNDRFVSRFGLKRIFPLFMEVN